MKYFKVLYRIGSLGSSLFDVDIEKQKTFLNHMQTPCDDVERSLCQYRCQMLFFKRSICFWLNLFSGLMLPWMIFYLYMKRRVNVGMRSEIIISLDGISRSLIPSHLDGTTFEFDKQVLSRKDIAFVLKLWKKKKFDFYFILKVVLKISQYRYIISYYAPRKIVVHSEYSFCSSILTYYCNMQGIKHINMMHGEKLFNIRDSFFRFNKCYVWDEHYINLFSSLRADPSQFQIAIPPSVKIERDKYIDNSCYADYKYYLSNNTPEELRRIVETMKVLEKYGFSIIVRPHPRYTDMEVLKQMLDNINIEDSHSISIEKSIVNVRSVIGTYSTVLYQAYLLGKNVILDDVVYKNLVDKLSKYKYIMMMKPHKLLSDELQVF